MRYHLTRTGLQDLTLPLTKLLSDLFVGEPIANLLDVVPVVEKLLDHPNLIFKLSTTPFPILTLGNRSVNKRQSLVFLGRVLDELTDGSIVLLHRIKVTDLSGCFYGEYVLMDSTFSRSLTRKKTIDEILTTL